MARVRTATTDDLEDLAELCRAAVGPDDYVLTVLDWMVREGEAVVTEDDGRIVAMAGVTECADRALWIGRMRTHPSFRRRGFAAMLLEHTRRRAVRERRPALRLLAGARNAASRALFRGTGFREVASFTRMSASASTKDAPSLRVDREGREAYRRWQSAIFHRAGRGYLAYQWHLLPLTLRTARILARKGVLLVGERAAVLAWTEEGERAAFASILAGGAEGLRAARTAAARMDRLRVEVFFPRDRRILAWAAKTGYRPAAWGHHLVLYERRVRR